MFFSNYANVLALFIVEEEAQVLNAVFLIHLLVASAFLSTAAPVIGIFIFSSKKQMHHFVTTLQQKQLYLFVSK